MGCTAEDPMAGGKENEIEIKIKTLDSQTYTMRVNKQVPSFVLFNYVTCYNRFMFYFFLGLLQYKSLLFS